MLIVELCSGILGYSNLAVGKPSSQSSIWSGQSAYLANDGNTRCDNAGYCSVTNSLPAPQWWAVDFGSPIFVYGVNLTNRAGCTYICFYIVNSVGKTHITSMYSFFVQRTRQYLWSSNTIELVRNVSDVSVTGVTIPRLSIAYACSLVRFTTFSNVGHCFYLFSRVAES